MYLINAQNMEHIKLINAQQAKSAYAHKNTKEKLLKMNTTIWFNKICQLNQKYITQHTADNFNF